MICTPVKIGDVTAIACGRSRPRKCFVCGARSDKLCDFPKGKGTCDKPLCGRCAVNVGEDRDYCPSHRQEALL